MYEFYYFILQTPISTVQEHSQVVSGMIWPTINTLATCSYDGSVRLWDVDTNMTQYKQYVAPCSVVSLHSSPFNNTLLINTIDRHVRLLDPREGRVIYQYKHI